MAFTLPDLPYEFDALEPVIDARTMEIHHDKHHATYVTNLNNATAGTEWENVSIDDLVRRISDVPEGIRTAVRNNGGGHYNHSLFWKVLVPPGTGGTPEGELAAAIERELGGMDSFWSTFTQAALTRFGSGWAWLYVSGDGTLGVGSTPNQDNPLMNGVSEIAGEPILGLDVWEHAYYLKYQNRRPDYVKSFAEVIDWVGVGAAYDAVRRSDRISGASRA